MNKIAVIDLTFCWPPWVSSSFEIKEILCRLQDRGLKVNLIVPHFTGYSPRGLITSKLPFPVTPVSFNRFTFNTNFLQKKIRRVVENFHPDSILIWDGYSLKPHLALDLSKDFPVIMKLCSYEILCLKTTLLADDSSICDNTFLKNPQKCIQCYFKGDLFKNFMKTFFRQKTGSRFQQLAHEFFSASAFKPSYPDIIKKSFNNVQAVIVSNNFTKGLLEGYCSKIKVIPHGVDSKLFKPGMEIKKKYKGVFMPEKLDGLNRGFFTFVEAIESLLSFNNNINNIKILLFSDEYFSQIRSERFKGNNYLFFFPSRNGTAPELYQMSDITVHPHISPESQGLRLIEAMACGKPVIASKVGVFNDIVEDGKTGFLVEPVNKDRLLEKMDLLLKNDEMCKSMGKEARTKVEAEYDWDIIIERDYIPLLQKNNIKDVKLKMLNSIRPKSKIHYVELAFNLAKKDLKVRYKTAGLGFLWAILNPLLMMVVLTAIFSVFIRIKTDVPYSIFVLTGLIPWTFFNLSLSSCTNSIIDNSNLIKKVYFPREIIPISIVLANFINFSMSIVILFLFLFIFSIKLSYLILFLPAIIAVQLIFTIGISLLTSSLNVYYRDIRYIVEATLLMWFYATPVFYPVTMVPERFRAYYFLNPMAGIISAYRDTLLSGKFPDMFIFSETASLSLIILLIGYCVFKKIEPVFADLI